MKPLPVLLSLGSVAVLLGALSSPGQVVLSEFMAINGSSLADEDGEHSDWIEIHNYTAHAVNLLNWSLTDNPGNPAKWRFPATNLNAGDFLIVFASEKDRRTPGAPLHTNFKLSGNGEYLALLSPERVVVTEFAPEYPPQFAEVAYGFTIPVTNFTLVATDAPVQVMVPADDGFGSAWTLPGFDDSAWIAGTNGVGFDTGEADPEGGSVSFTNAIHTDLSDVMPGQNSSAYLRYAFNLDDPSQVNRLVLHVKYDDGFVAYLNGNRVAWRQAPDESAYDSAATAPHPDDAALQFEEVSLTDSAGALLVGPNVLAIQGLNVSATNVDFLIVAELSADTLGDYSPEPRYFTHATPGAPNGLGTTDLGPIISRLDAIPAPPYQPTDADDLTVVAQVTPSFSPVTNVVLNWRVMFGPTNTTPMRDDGLHGDGLTGDRIYGAIIPAGAATNGQMVRWYVTAHDAQGRQSRWPLFEDPNNSAEYLGTVIVDPNVVTKLPLFQVFISSENVAGIDLESGARVSFFYDGEFYDNIYMERRGNTTAAYPKKSHRLEFNSEHPLRHPGPGGRILKTSLLAEHADPSYLRQHLSFWMMDLMGVPTPFDYPVRVQTNGVFYQLAFHNDVLGKDQAERLGYPPNGALYKAAGTIQTNYYSTGGFEKKTRQWEGREDYDALVLGIIETNSLAERRAYVFDHLNVPEIINYLSVARFTEEGDDVWANMSLYRNTDGNGEWSIIPFDLNVSWGQLYCGDAPTLFNTIVATNDAQKSHPLYGGSQVKVGYRPDVWNRIYDVIIAVPETRQMLLRRIRTLMDKFVQPPGTPFEQSIIEQHIVSVTNLIWREAFLDREKWGWPCSGTCGMYCWGTDLWLTNGVDGLISEFNEPRREHFFFTHCVVNTNVPVSLGNSYNAGIPLEQPNDTWLWVSELDYNPASGNQAEEYLCLTNPNPYAVDLSGWKLDGAVRFAFQSGTVIPSNSVLYVSPDVVAFRARTNGPNGSQGFFVQGPYQGQLSARGETLLIKNDHGLVVSTNTYVGDPSPAQQYLRITELMFNPAPPSGYPGDAQAFEFIELKNIGPAPLDLTGVYFTNGIQFAFAGSAVTSLDPGQIVLVAQDVTAFTARYGTGFNLAGQYEGFLDNAGERIRLLDAHNEEILDFEYNDTWYPAADGFGFSLVIVDENAEPDLWGDRSNWQPSGTRDGSPGTQPAVPAIAPIIINEVLTHTDPPLQDAIEIFNPTGDEVDVGGWFLTDDRNTPQKYRIPDGTLIAAGGYRVFYETNFNPFPGVPPSFALSSDGDEVYLYSGDAQTNLTGYAYGLAFDAAASGVSLGWYTNSVRETHFVPQATVSLGSDNAGPKVGPVIIRQIMYHPLDLLGGLDNPADEFIELHNLSDQAVPLFAPMFPTNTWHLRGGVEFDFPTNVTLPPGNSLLVVNFDPNHAETLTAFRSRYVTVADLPVYGPYSGKLDNDTDRVALNRPDTPNANGVPRILVEEVNYHDASPWPDADGNGAALQRLDPTQYGDDPVNWRAISDLANLTAWPHTNIVFSVVAIGAGPLQYQWQHNGTNLEGATAASLAIDDVEPIDAGEYWVIITDDAGSVQVGPAVLTVPVEPTILHQPVPSHYDLVAGNTATLSIAAASSTTLRYQWFHDDAELPGETNATLALANAQAANDGDYTVLVADDYGSVLSDTVNLKTWVRPTISVASWPQPRNQSVVAGGTATITVAVQTTATLPLLYRWKRIDWETNYVYELDSYTNVLVLTNINAVDHAGGWRVVVSNFAGEASTFFTANLTVLEPPTITEQPDGPVGESRRDGDVLGHRRGDGAFQLPVVAQ